MVGTSLRGLTVGTVAVFATLTGSLRLRVTASRQFSPDQQDRAGAPSRVFVLV